MPLQDSSTAYKLFKNKHDVAVANLPSGKNLDYKDKRPGFLAEIRALAFAAALGR